MCTIFLLVDAVFRNHWSELCCTKSVCLLGLVSFAWAGQTQCDCSSETDPGQTREVN